MINSSISRLAWVAAVSVAAAWSSAAQACDGTAVVCTLQADALPTDQPWTQPAKFAYTINDDAPDSFAIDVAGKVNRSLGKSDNWFITGDLVWHRNNQQKKEQNNLQAAGGLHYEIDNAGDNPAEWDRGKLWSLFADLKLGYARKAVYADKTKPACIAAPSSIACNTQHVESLRATLDLSPFNGLFESEQPFTIPNPDGGTTGRFEGPAAAYSVGVVGTLFTDKVLNNTLNPDTGTSITGTVHGTRVTVGAALSPRFLDYRLVFRLSGQAVQTLSRSSGRREDFDSFSHLVTASVDFDLADRSLAKGARTFRPSFGITYTDGEDPLTARPDQSSIVIAFKVAFK